MHCTRCNFQAFILIRLLWKITIKTIAATTHSPNVKAQNTMKLIIQNNSIAGTATDEYTGPDAFITAPDDFDASRMGEYVITDGVATLPPVDIVADFDTALTSHLDSTAQSRRYDNRITCAVRAGYAGPFQAEGAAFALWMDNCNALAYQMLAAVQAGTAPMPESPQAFIDSLPAMVWPT